MGWRKRGWRFFFDFVGVAKMGVAKKIKIYQGEIRSGEKGLAKKGVAKIFEKFRRVAKMGVAKNFEIFWGWRKKSWR